MITVRHIERLFNARDYLRLYRELIGGRLEGSYALESTLGRVVPTAALALIRLDELTQGRHPLARRLASVIVTAQERDGGWSEPMTTALCVRALLCTGQHCTAIDRGIAYLAALQKTEGIWPKEPIRRLPADAFVSAFILLQLTEQAAFRGCVRFEAALSWFRTHTDSLDDPTRRLWEHMRIRCRMLLRQPAAPNLFSPAAA